MKISFAWVLEVISTNKHCLFMIRKLFSCAFIFVCYKWRSRHEDERNGMKPCMNHKQKLCRKLFSSKGGKKLKRKIAIILHFSRFHSFTRETQTSLLQSFDFVSGFFRQKFSVLATSRKWSVERKCQENY